MKQSFAVIGTCLVVSGLAMATGLNKKDRLAKKLKESTKIAALQNQKDDEDEIP